MKKLVIMFMAVMCLILGSLTPAWSATGYDVVVVNSLTGSSNSLDAVVRTTRFVSYKDGTLAIVAVPDQPVVFYVYKAASTDAESLPVTVIPNNNRSGVGAWKRIGTYGVSGATWRYGAIAPEAGTGVLNDFYLDTVTSNIYNKTAVDAWTLIGNIKGVDGDDGADGNTWTCAAGIPDDDDGENSDMYLDTTALEVYTKENGAWVSKGVIKGTNGYTWAIGEGVPDNGTGVTRDLYLNTLTYEIYQKGDVAWASIGNIKGATGAAGSGIVNGALNMTALSADPADPVDGSSVQWVSDGTGAGDPGDVMMKITVGATTKTTTLVDFSALAE